MQNHCTVLLVENNPDDARLAQLAFEKAHLNQALSVVRDGEEALEFLKSEGQYRERAGLPLPKLILLDLGMPGVSGLELLERLQREPALREIPVTVLSGSSRALDVDRAYALGAKSFLEKTADIREFSASLKALVERCIPAGSAPARLRYSYGI